IGTAVLEISKYVMYNHYYNVLKKTYPDVRLLYTDTDSLIFQVKTEDLFADMIKYPELRNTFDSSNLSKTHPLYKPCIKNKGKYGCFKDETNGEVIEKFVGLRAKMYAVQYNEKLKKRAKGIKGCEVKKYMFDNYHKALMGTTADELRQEVEMNTLRSYNHQMYAVRLKKTGLCALDDKRWVCDDLIHTLAHGHYHLFAKG